MQESINRINFEKCKIRKLRYSERILKIIITLSQNKLVEKKSDAGFPCITFVYQYF